MRVELVGSLVSTGDPWEPFRLVDACGEPVGAVTAYLAELQAAGRSTATQRSYGMDLLRWFRFLSAVEVAWQEATRPRRETSPDGFRWHQTRSAALAFLRQACSGDDTDA